MDFKSVLSMICIDIQGQTNLEVNWTQIYHFALQPPKPTKNGHISWKSHFAFTSIPFFILPVNHQKAYSPTFFMDLSETFRIDVNMDFTSTNHGGFLILVLKKVLSPKSNLVCPLKGPRSIFVSFLIVSYRGEWQLPGIFLVWKNIQYCS